MKDDIRERLHQVMVQNARSEHEQRKLCVVKPDDVALGHLHEQISSEAAALAQLGKGPTDMLRALAELQLYGLSAMAAEVHHHATVQRLTDATKKMLAEKSPIWVDNKTLFAVPVGELDTAGLQRFSDRVLQTIQDRKIKKVVLHLDSLVADASLVSQWRTQLAHELGVSRLTIPKT